MKVLGKRKVFALVERAFISNHCSFNVLMLLFPAKSILKFAIVIYPLDAVEGIDDHVVPGLTSDPVVRVSDGVLTIGFHGYKILQPPGPGPY